MDSESKGRVLLIYPNSEGLGGIPNGLALLSACLKRAGYATRCFDTTFLHSPPVTYAQRSKHGFFKDTDYMPYWGGWTEDLPAKIPSLLVECINEFKPDLIAVTCVDACLDFIERLMRIIRQNFSIPIILGGITCTSAPDLILSKKRVDIICVGEGENALVQLADAIVGGKDYSNIRNLWIKKPDGSIIKNELRCLHPLDDLPFQDWSIFDPRHHYKPYCGKFMKTLFVEMARGCHFSCTYCVNNTLRRMYKGLGEFIRNREVDKTLDEIVYLRNRWGIELVFFIDDNFLGMAKERFNYFCEQYLKRVNLPFYIQTRSETIKEEYIEALAKINISTIAIGVEHGHEAYRRKYLNRRMSNESIVRAFKIVHQHGIRTTANIIIGMPYEEETMMVETIDLLKRVKPTSVSVNYFAPYQGTAMREMAVKERDIPPDHQIKDTNVCYGTGRFPSERMVHYYENLKKYINGELEYGVH
jgi:anaerobic magnesium-protoporphyrin IX monomethyl ester cyclase